MSLQIEQIVLHQLVKEDEQTLNLVLREQPLAVTTAVQQMMEELNRVYSSKSRAFGQFDQQSQLAIGLSLYLQGDEAFIDFSRSAVQQLREEISKYPFAEGCIVVFCHYRYLAVEYLLVAQLSSCSSMRVNETLELSSTHYLDIAHADIVVRIDLTEWQVNPDSNRYVTFLKGRVGRRVADFFLDFLGASEGLDSKAQNKELLQAVTDYCQQQPLADSERQIYQQQVYSYCNGQLQAGEEIELRGVAQALPVLGEQDFQQFSSEQGYELEESFPADRSTLRQLTRFSGSGGGITINFDAGLLGERIIWNPATDTLTIKGTPPNLRDQLQRRSGGKQD